MLNVSSEEKEKMTKYFSTICEYTAQEGEESYAKCSGLRLKTVVLAFNTL